MQTFYKNLSENMLLSNRHAFKFREFILHEFIKGIEKTVM
jgi:hypothetical protein